MLKQRKNDGRTFLFEGFENKLSRFVNHGISDAQFFRAPRLPFLCFAINTSINRSFKSTDSINKKASNKTNKIEEEEKPAGRAGYASALGDSTAESELMRGSYKP